jgi:hypothetical protein
MPPKKQQNQGSSSSKVKVDKVKLDFLPNRSSSRPNQARTQTFGLKNVRSTSWLTGSYNIAD